MNPKLEVYTTLVLSTAHLPREELDQLARLTWTPERQEAIAYGELDHEAVDAMVMQRDTGFIIKLYDEAEFNLKDERRFPVLNHILATRGPGFQAVEFDCDGPVMAGWFRTYP